MNDDVQHPTNTSATQNRLGSIPAPGFGRIPTGCTQFWPLLIIRIQESPARTSEKETVIGEITTVGWFSVENRKLSLNPYLTILVSGRQLYVRTTHLYTCWIFHTLNQTLTPTRPDLPPVGALDKFRSRGVCYVSGWRAGRGPGGACAAAGRSYTVVA